MRIVLDTNVIVSGLMTPNGNPAKLLNAWIGRRFTLVTSPDQLRELARVLTYDKIKKRVDPEDAAAFFENVGKLAERVEARSDITDSPFIPPTSSLPVTLPLKNGKQHQKGGQERRI